MKNIKKNFLIITLLAGTSLLASEKTVQEPAISQLDFVGKLLEIRQTTPNFFDAAQKIDHLITHNISDKYLGDLALDSLVKNYLQNKSNRELNALFFDFSVNGRHSLSALLALKKAGGDINTIDGNRSATPLMWAIEFYNTKTNDQQKYLQTIKDLLAAGANPETKAFGLGSLSIKASQKDAFSLTKKYNLKEIEALLEKYKQKE
ncbi:MAG: hypothetical protein AB7R69_02950 [Candidatus Babeliales bacterium]